MGTVYHRVMAYRARQREPEPRFDVVVKQGMFEVRKYEGSMGYQVWKNGVFFVFCGTWSDAYAWLTKTYGE